MISPSFAKCDCQHCGNHLEFPIEAAGVTIPCPHCGQSTQLLVPAAASAPVPDGPPSIDELLASFSGPVARTPVSFFYKLGLGFVTVMMILLPLIYLALIAAAAYGVYFYATHFYGILLVSGGGLRGLFFKLVLYITPLFVGTVLVFFLIKPLLARRGPRAQPLALNPEVEPTLYAFIAKICQTVGAPMPRRIDIDCQLNASAGFRRGLWSLFGNDLVLTIGVPLVAGLTVRQFAGVVAHEFGHFTQGFGMRMTYIIASINGWFARVVYQRDAWDYQLEMWAAESEDFRILLIINSARFSVWCSRLFLRILMVFANLGSCFLMRQMEYDADSYEIKLAGSAAFESTAGRLRVLGQASENAYKRIVQSFETSRRLPDNFPAFLAHHDANLPANQSQQIVDKMGLSKTGLFDTHPSDGDRIRRSRQAGNPGVFELDVPAMVLFANFEAVSKQVTLLHYSDDVGIPLESVSLIPTEQVIEGGGHYTPAKASSGPAPRFRLRTQPS